MIIKASDYGSLETIWDHVSRIKDKNGKCHFQVLKYEVGKITETDLIEALEFDCPIYCMDIAPQGNIEYQANTERIPIHTYDIIYKLFEDLQAYNEELATKQNTLHNILGVACVQQIFEID